MFFTPSNLLVQHVGWLIQGLGHTRTGKRTGKPTKTDEFSEKFQTVFDPPLFSKNHIEDFAKKMRMSKICKKEKFIRFCRLTCP